MSIPLSAVLLLNLIGAALPVEEPDGSRTIGIVPPFRAEPAPPGWLRVRSHRAAAVQARHYLYAAYAGAEGRWLVRYQALPEEGEAAGQTEQCFLFQADERKPPRRLKNAEVKFESGRAIWKNRTFTLVDRRDLMKP